MQIHQIFISPGHNYVGHFGRPPGDFPVQEVDRVECVAGHGLRGDRYFDHRENYKGQITFFAREVFDQLCAAYPGIEKSPGVLRRNVIVSGVDLLALVGQDFEIDGVKFHGTQHCAPCDWMEIAFAPGTKTFLRKNAGLRARILTDGWLRTGVAEIASLAAST